MNDEYLIYGETLTGIADSIRSVSSVSTTWTPDEMAAYILANLVKPTTRQAAKTYTPSTANQTIPAGTFLTGNATIAGDADLAAANIVKGKNIFNVAGSASGIWGTPDSFYRFSTLKSGSFTLTSAQTTNYTVTHNLGVLPKFVALYSEDNESIGNTGIKVLGGVMAFQTTSETQVTTSATTSGTYMMAVCYSDYNNRFSTSSVVCATPKRGNSSSRNTMLTTTNSNSSGYTPVTSLNNSSFVIPYGTSYHMSNGTYKWLVMA